MIRISEAKQEENNQKKQAFSLQFGGTTNDIRKMMKLSYDYNPTIDIECTGLFGILDALIDLGLNHFQIERFYIHGHVSPYTDPDQFTKGIIRIVNGMNKESIKKEYGYYFDDATIDRISNPSKNTRMLLSFCYGENDMYEFVPNEDDLFDRFMEKYRLETDEFYAEYYEFLCKNKKQFSKIDGKLFRAIHFIVRQGYDFPELESLFNEEIKNIVFKQSNGTKNFILNREYARNNSDHFLSLIRFLKKNNYKLLTPENLFNPHCDNIRLIDSNGEQVSLSKSFLEFDDIDKYTAMQMRLEDYDFKVSNIASLCDRRIKEIEIEHIAAKNEKSTIMVKREKLDLISREILAIMKDAYGIGFSFKDSDNLLDTKQELIKITDSNGIDYLTDRKQLSKMLKIIIKCKSLNFRVNLSQLFNSKQSMVELIDSQGKKSIVNRDRIMDILDIYKLLRITTYCGYSIDNYDSLFDESQQYISCRDRSDRECIISRKQIYKILELNRLSLEEKEKLSDSDKNLLSMLQSDELEKKLYQWLPYTAKKWIPSSAVIGKIPAERSYEYFHNNNHTRLKILKDEFKPKNYDEMEGIVSLGYILGLFDSKESTSKRALEYIINYFFKKGITADELHITYGGINLLKGYDKKFADFFMQHYSRDRAAFIDQYLGTNMVGEIFTRFDEILRARPEKKIKTRTINQLLTPTDAISIITSVKVDNNLLGEKANDERYVNLAKLLARFGASKDELKWAIDIYTQALAIDEQNVKIPHIEDSKSNLMTFHSHLKSDPQAFVSGRKTNCCSRYGGYAQDRLTHVINDPNWRYVTFTSPTATFYDGLVWYDEQDKVACIDNVEGQFSSVDKNNKEAIALMADAIIRYSDGIYHKMHELGIPCLKVNVGKDPGTVSWDIFKYAYQQKLITDEKTPCEYPARNKITSDAGEQFTITDEKTLSLRRSIIK